MRSPKTRGQLAIGIAFAFTAFIAMFGLIFNSSWLVREKMQLQQSTDYAALRGAYVQKENLNYIREKNEQIEKLFQWNDKVIKAPHCGDLMAFTNSCPQVIAASTSVTGKAATSCTDACQNYDEFKRARLINTYELNRLQITDRLVSSLKNANQVAFEESKRYFFSRENIPFGLRRILFGKLGRSLSSKQMTDYYNKGALSDTLTLVNTQELENGSVMPLFTAKFENRDFIYPVYKYPPGTEAPVSPSCVCSLLAPIAGVKKKSVLGKVVRADEENTTFMIAAYYHRAKTAVESTIKVLLRNPNDENRAPVRSSATSEARLFRRENYPMTSWSMARPYGGAFPEGAKNVLDRGKIGSEFTGIKLIGIADPREQGTTPRPFNISGDEFNMEGFSAGGFLH